MRQCAAASSSSISSVARCGNGKAASSAGSAPQSKLARTERSLRSSTVHAPPATFAPCIGSPVSASSRKRPGARSGSTARPMTSKRRAAIRFAHGYSSGTPIVEPVDAYASRPLRSPSSSPPRWRSEAQTMPAPGATSASRSPARSVTVSTGVTRPFPWSRMATGPDQRARPRGRRPQLLLQLDAPSGLLELGLAFVGLVAVDALLDGLGRLVDERLGLLEAEPGRRADDLDDLDLLVAGAGQDDVDRGLLLGGGAVLAARAGAGRRGRRGDGAGRHAELLLERLDALGQLEHRDALELVDPLLGAGHVVVTPRRSESKVRSRRACPRPRPGRAGRPRASRRGPRPGRRRRARCPPRPGPRPRAPRRRAPQPAPRTKASAVGPSSRLLSTSAPAWSAARSVSVFLTTVKRVSASRSWARSSAACGTLIPR